MKKLLSVILAVVMVLSLATVAFAASKTEITFNKSYTVNGKVGDADVFPAETLKFKVTAKEGNPDYGMITIADLTIGSSATNTATVKLPKDGFEKVGKYNYTVKEIAGNTQGVEYTTGTFDVQVLVTWNADHTAKETDIVFTTKATPEGKVDDFTNVYNLGSLQISKTVDGNLGDRSAYFTMHVTLKAEKTVLSNIVVGTKTYAPSAWVDGELTFDVSLKHGDVITINNIPAGVTYTVEEDAKHGEGEDGFDANSATDTDYTISYTGETGTIETSKTAEAQVKNTKGTTVETGITLDSIPFVLMLVVCAGAAVLFVTKRRTVEF